MVSEAEGRCRLGRCPLCDLGRKLHAREVLEKCRRELGEDLGGFGAVNLLLDQGVAETVDDARVVLASIGELPDEEPEEPPEPDVDDGVYLCANCERPFSCAGQREGLCASCELDPEAVEWYSRTRDA